jgi:hypothetical protein
VGNTTNQFWVQLYILLYHVDHKPFVRAHLLLLSRLRPVLCALCSVLCFRFSFDVLNQSFLLKMEFYSFPIRKSTFPRGETSIKFRGRYNKQQGEEDKNNRDAHWERNKESTPTRHCLLLFVSAARIASAPLTTLLCFFLFSCKLQRESYTGPTYPLFTTPVCPAVEADQD